MTTDTNMMKRERGYRSFAFGGGLVGLVLFLAVGLLPSLVYGGYAGVVLAAAIVGHPIEAGLFERGMVVTGMVFGLFATGAVFVVVSSAVGAGLYALAASFTKVEVKVSEPEAPAADKV